MSLTKDHCLPIEIHTKEDLQDYFSAYSKPKDLHRIGLEAELFVVDKVTGHALPYDGERGIENILRTLARKHFYHEVEEKGRIIGLVRKDLSVTLEPGGQVELSAPPVDNCFQVEEQIRLFVGQLNCLKQNFPNIAWISAGVHPFSSVEEISWLPKHRYKIMSERLPEFGSLSHNMMKTTGTNQVNFDYLNEKDAMRKIRAATFLTPFVTALFSNSSFSEGQWNGFDSYRIHIWQNTDSTRTGLLTQFLKTGTSFNDYLQYVLRVPLLFIERGGQLIEVRGLNFEEFIQKGYQGYKATVDDFELQLSLVFPEIRLKQYIEVRGADGQHPHLMASVAAFWKGILYGENALSKIEGFIEGVSEQDVQSLFKEIPKSGMRASWKGTSLCDWAETFVDISCRSLAEQTTDKETRSECVFLDRIRTEICKARMSPAEKMRDHFGKSSNPSPEDVIQYLDVHRDVF